MSSPAEFTIAAARMRMGDALPAYGENVQVTRPPIVSNDGAMVTAVIAKPGDFSSRVVRVPVDQTIKVIRPGVAPNAKFVRQAKTVKSSGAKVLVLDLAHPDSEIAPVGDQRYATLCTAHHSIRFHMGSSTAEAIASHPEEWCPPCLNATRARAHSRIHDLRRHA